MTNSDLTGKIIGCAMKVHTELGPGLLESVYQTCLLYELKRLGLNVESEKRISIKYDGIELNGGHRIDLVVENNLIV